MKTALPTLCLFGAFVAAVSASNLRADPALPFQFGDIGADAHPALPGHYALYWSLFDTATGEPAAPDLLDALFFHVRILVAHTPTAQPVLHHEGEATGPMHTFPAADTPGELPFYSFEIVSHDALGNTIAQSPQVSLDIPPARTWQREGDDCPELLIRLIEARQLCAGIDCSDLAAQLEAARLAMEEAERLMAEERARRLEAASQVAPLQKAAMRLNRDLDRLADDLNAAKEKLRDAIQAHYDARAQPSGSQALPLHLGGAPSGEEGSWTVFNAAPGVDLAIHSPGSTAAEREHWARLMQNDLKNGFGKTQEFRDLLDAIKAIEDAIRAKEAELGQTEAALQAADQAAHHQSPVDLDYRAAREAYEAALAAYNACVAEKEKWCAEAERLERELERCERLAAIARALREARKTEDEARKNADEAREILDGIPEGIREGSSPAGTQAGTADDERRHAEAKADEARDLQREAEEKAAQGDIEGAEQAAGEARQRAETAADAARAAAERARRAKQLADAEEQARIQRQAAEQRLRVQEFLNWQKRRKACIEFLLEQSVQEGSGQLTLEELADLKDALDSLADLGNTMTDAIELWRDLNPLDPAFTQALQNLQARITAVMGPLNKLRGKIAGIQSLFDTLTTVKAQLDILAAGGDAPEDAARKFGAWLVLISTGLNESVGSIPILQFVTGYFSFLVDGYLAALDGIDAAERAIYETALRELGSAKLCPQLLALLVNGLSLDQITARYVAQVPPVLYHSLNPERLERYARAMLGRRLSECCEGQLKQRPPAVSYGQWSQSRFAPNPAPASSSGAASLSSSGYPPGEGPLDSPAADGLPNFAKYYLGLDPNEPSAWTIDAALLPWNDGATAFAIVFDRNPQAVGVEAILEHAPSLEDDEAWQQVECVLELYPDTAGDTEQVVIFSFPPMLLDSAPDLGFYRLRLEWIIVDEEIPADAAASGGPGPD